MKILDIGCGHSKVAGAVGMDNNPLVNPDVLHDMEKIPYPFADEEFDAIHACQVLEHIIDIIPIMKEIHRIAKTGAHVMITVPHFSGKTAYMDPSHRSFYAWPSFTYFTKDYFYIGARYEIVNQYMTFSKLFKFTGISWIANRVPRFYEDYLQGFFPARNICATLKVVR